MMNNYLHKIRRSSVVIVNTAILFFACASYADHDVDDLKKLFTDRGQRAQIDATRSGNNSGTELQQTNKLNLNGYMVRSGGEPVVWVNNQSTMNKSNIGDIRVHKNKIGKNKKVAVSVDGQTKYLKPGETWFKDSGKVVDSQ